MHLIICEYNSGCCGLVKHLEIIEHLNIEIENYHTGFLLKENISNLLNFVPKDIFIQGGRSFKDSDIIIYNGDGEYEILNDIIFNAVFIEK